MRVMVFGARGMLGSEVARILRERHGVLGTTADISSEKALNEAFNFEPDVIVNCAGIVKSECGSERLRQVFAVNTMAPHAIARLARERLCRVIHISSDCVFSGLVAGKKTEESDSDATDLYGVSKFYGELLGYDHCVTLRTSFIGRDHARGRGLLEWLLSNQDSSVPGYSNHLWTGLSAAELARVIGKTVSDESLCGLYHVAGPLISKSELLETLIDAYGLRSSVRIEPVAPVDRSLDGSKFQSKTGYSPPSWAEMARELAAA